MNVDRPARFTALPVLANHRCRICGWTQFRRIDFESIVLPNHSAIPSLHEFENFLCERCGVVFSYPEIIEEKLIQHYNQSYRRSAYAMQVNGAWIDLPIAVPWSGISFRRFETLRAMIEAAARQDPSTSPQADDLMIDLGAYQGLLLYAAKRTWGCRTLAYDYNVDGMKFARDALGIDEVKVAEDIYTDKPRERARFVVLVHSFEHLRDPNRFLLHLKENVLLPDGLLYLEVPNVLGCPLSDPTHFFMYSPESLRFALSQSGFEVTALKVHGLPRSGLSTWENDAMNISVIAKPRPPGGAPSPQALRNPKSEYARIRRAHRQVAVGIGFHQAVVSASALCRLCYYAVFLFVLEPLSPRAAQYLRRLIRSWRHSTGTR